MVSGFKIQVSGFRFEGFEGFEKFEGFEAQVGVIKYYLGCEINCVFLQIEINWINTDEKIVYQKCGPNQ